MVSDTRSGQRNSIPTCPNSPPVAFVGANIWVIAASIGLTTFLLTTVGMLIGRPVGQRFGKAELIRSLALFALGLTILLEHLGAPGG